MLEEGGAVALKFGLADAGDGEESGVVVGTLVGHLSQGGVAEDDVGGDALVGGELFAEGAELLEEGSGLRAERRPPRKTRGYFWAHFRGRGFRGWRVRG